jgi:hypothetical protein
MGLGYIYQKSMNRPSRFASQNERNEQNISKQAIRPNQKITSGVKTTNVKVEGKPAFCIYRRSVQKAVGHIDCKPNQKIVISKLSNIQ